MNKSPGILMDPLISYVAAPRSLKGMSESLRHYVEHGEPSSAKQMEMKRVATARQ